MIPATDYLKLLTDPTRTRPFDTRIDSYSTNLALAHSLMEGKNIFLKIYLPLKSDMSSSLLLFFFQFEEIPWQLQL